MQFSESSDAFELLQDAVQDVVATGVSTGDRMLHQFVKELLCSIGVINLSIYGDPVEFE